MDKALKDRSNFIGGSEANMMYMNYHTKTFQKWWECKLTGFPAESFTNRSMAVGTILESDIIDLYERVNGVRGERDLQLVKGFARGSTDYIIGDKVSDVKATGKAFEWFLNNKVPINYKRQLIHYMYVFGLKKASIIAYQVNDDLLNVPFQELSEDKLFEIEVPITEEEIQTHKTKLEFLEHCKEINIYPG